MTKAQQVRSKRLEKIHKTDDAEAQKIFDWILDLMDADTKKGYLGPIEVFMWYDRFHIQTNHSSATYDLSKVHLEYDRVTLFTKLYQLINKEDGFKATLAVNGTLWYEKAIVLNVFIEV